MKYIDIYADMIRTICVFGSLLFTFFLLGEVPLITLFIHLAIWLLIDFIFLVLRTFKED